MAPPHPKTVDFYEKPRKDAAASLLPNTFVTRNIACFYGSAGHQLDKEHIKDTVFFIERTFETIERNFDLQRFNKTKSKFAVYISHTGLEQPVDLPPAALGSTNEHLTILAPSLFHHDSDRAPIVREMCNALLHIPSLYIQESIVQYIVYHVIPTYAPYTYHTGSLFKKFHRLNPFGTTLRKQHKILPAPFWDFIARCYGGAKTVGDIADFAFNTHAKSGAPPHTADDDPIEAIATYLKTTPFELMHAWLRHVPHPPSPTPFSEAAPKLEKYGYDLVPLCPDALAALRKPTDGGRNWIHVDHPDGFLIMPLL